MLLTLRLKRWKRLFWLRRCLQRCRRLVNPGRRFAHAVWDGTPRWGRVVINFSSGADWGQKCGINHRGQQRSASLLARPRSQCDKPHVRHVVKHGWEDSKDSTNDTGVAALWPSTGQGQPNLLRPSSPVVRLLCLHGGKPSSSYSTYDTFPSGLESNLHLKIKNNGNQDVSPNRHGYTRARRRLLMTRQGLSGQSISRCCDDAAPSTWRGNCFKRAVILREEAGGGQSPSTVPSKIDERERKEVNCFNL